jgi:hypothetical protein
LDDPSPHHAARADRPVLHRLPPRRAPDGVMVGVLARCRRSITTPPTSIRSEGSAMIASRRMIAKMPTIAAWPTSITSASPSSIRERSRLRVQLPADVLCGSLRGIRGQPGPGARHGQDLHPARRPRAERVDLDGASGRLFGRQPVRLHRRRHRLPLGPGSRRRQRSGAQHAERNRQSVDRIPEFVARPRTRTIRSA